MQARIAAITCGDTLLSSHHHYHYHYHCHHLERSEAVRQCGGGEQQVGGLGHVCRVEVVMVRDTLEDNWREGTKTRVLHSNLQVMILDGHEEGE